MIFFIWYRVYPLEAQRLIEARPYFKQLYALDKIIETALLYN